MTLLRQCIDRRGRLAEVELVPTESRGKRRKIDRVHQRQQCAHGVLAISNDRIDTVRPFSRDAEWSAHIVV